MTGPLWIAVLALLGLFEISRMTDDEIGMFIGGFGVMLTLLLIAIAAAVEAR